MKYLTALWKTGTAYNVGDGVNYNRVEYYCEIAHTSTSTFDSTKFRRLNLEDNYSSPMRTQVFNDRFVAIDLIEIHIKNIGQTAIDPLYLTNGSFDISYQSLTAHNGAANTYKAQGEFMGFSNVPEEFDVKVGKFSIYLSAINTNYISLFKNTEVEGKRVVIHKAFLDYNTLAVLDRPVMIFDGIIQNIAITESARTASLTVDCATLFSDFERTAGRKTNNGSNWLYQGSTYDMSMDKTGISGNSEIKWGRVN